LLFTFHARLESSFKATSTILAPAGIACPRRQRLCVVQRVLGGTDKIILDRAAYGSSSLWGVSPLLAATFHYDVGTV